MEQTGKKAIWQEYQKEIAEDKYYYARSCIRQNFFPGSEHAFLNILRNNLKKDLHDDAKHTTCTGIGYHSDVVPMETTMTVVARNFSLMTEAGYQNYIPSCITSFGLYTEIIETWKHFPETLEKTRDFLFKATKRTFDLPNNLAHTSDIIYKFRHEIAAMAKYKLVDVHTGRPLRIVDHIGCHYSKMFPEKGVGGAEYPYVLAGMVEAWGGETIDYPERRHCCGFGFRQYLVKANRSYSLSASRKKFESMQPYEPDFIITNCPGCPYFMDRWQYVIAETEHKVYGAGGKAIPVLTYEEMAGLVLGYNPWDLGLQMHQVPIEPLLEKMRIAYNPAEKYLGVNGKDLGKPVIPELFKYQDE
ncbi:MAG: heterodisulfide reductase subunit B [Bacteroidetes bacterium HGW-Bacteroidetes-21]|jgi:heterodisulfide reductase subunit B|nr:MAG: heterodisulfide reductase subunit B [Bacteroidetes bacterium HGW-Bacteroidetes-21]